MPVTINGSTGLTGVAAIDSVSSTELGYVDGVTSAIQTQLNGKLATPGAWTDYTPTVAQGASTNIAKTVNYAKYAQMGKIVHCNIYVSLTAAGTTGSAITLTLPVNTAVGQISIGSGLYARGNGAYSYLGIAYTASASTIALAQGAVASPNYLVGTGFAAASGDGIYFNLTYEAA